MDLATLQARFQQAVVDGDDGVLDEIIDSPKESRDVLLGVYRNAYVLRLIDFLMNDYPKLHALLGDEQFGKIARSFIAAHPSGTPNARWFGERLPAFLTAADRYEHHELLADLADLERALNDVFDAEDAVSLTIEALGQVQPEDWPALTFTAHPAIRRLDLVTNAAEYWQALHNETDPPEPATLGDDNAIIAYRDDGMASFRPMAADETMMWDEAANGVTFSVLCEMLAMHGGEDDAAVRAAGYLQNWIGAGLLAGIAVAG